jgi:hypothetical protein
MTSGSVIRTKSGRVEREGEWVLGTRRREFGRAGEKAVSRGRRPLKRDLTPLRARSRVDGHRVESLHRQAQARQERKGVDGKGDAIPDHGRLEINARATI